MSRQYILYHMRKMISIRIDTGLLAKTDNFLSTRKMTRTTLLERGLILAMSEATKSTKSSVPKNKPSIASER